MENFPGEITGWAPSLNKFKKIAIISRIFCPQGHGTRNHKKTGKVTIMWRLNNMLQNNQWSKEDIKGKQKSSDI